MSGRDTLMSDIQTHSPYLDYTNNIHTMKNSSHRMYIPGVELWFLVWLPILVILLTVLCSISTSSVNKTSIKIDIFKYKDCASWLLSVIRALRMQCVQLCSKAVDANNFDANVRVPTHIAVIMDGNRRYGKARYGVGLQGHADGCRKLISFIDWCISTEIKILTVYAFSTENWNRPQAEVQTLFDLFHRFMHEIIPKALNQSIRIRVLVTKSDKVPQNVMQLKDDVEQRTLHCQRLQLNVCVSYGGRDEIVNACKAIAEKAVQKCLQVSDIDDALLQDHLLTREIPDPDLLLRTSGENRLSNFLLYQSAYTELIFIDKLWPELTKLDFDRVIKEYSRRSRRFGK